MERYMREMRKESDIKERADQQTKLLLQKIERVRREHYHKPAITALNIPIVFF